MAEIYFSKNILHVHFQFSYFSLFFSPFLTYPSMISCSHLPLSFLFIFLFSPIFIFLSICFFLFFYFLLFYHLFLFILYEKVYDPRIRRQILLCVVQIILMNFLVHKLNEFEQLIIIFKIYWIPDWLHKFRPHMNLQYLYNKTGWFFNLSYTHLSY